MQGIIAAVPTALDADGHPRKSAFLEHCQWMLDNGCDGLNILGSTGEANSISNADRTQIMEWASTNLDTSRLMVGTGTPSLDDTIKLTRHAGDLGYSVALVLPPYYYKPVTDEGLIAWYRALDHALQDHKIEIYFYNFPQMTGINIPEEVISKLVADRPQRFTGIKDSSGDLDYCRNILAACPQLAVFPSSETSLSEAHKAGFAGCISATVNITAPLCAEVWKNRKVDIDPEIMEEIGRVRSTIANAGLIPAIKHLVGRRTGDKSWENVLAPFVPADSQTKKSLDQNIQI